MAALPALITVEQFRELPDDGKAYELHHGEIVEVTRPKAKHYNLQRRLVNVLQSRLAGIAEVGMELPYRPVAEFDLRVADVAIVVPDRWEQMDPEDNLHGAPDLVIEVKSPSNTKRHLQELATLCLNNGAQEFWIADPDKQSITVIRGDGVPHVYSRGDSIPLETFGAAALELSSVFA